MQNVLKTRLNNSRCPECGREVFFPTIQDGGTIEDPIVWCRDMGHWSGLLSETKPVINGLRIIDLDD